MDAARSVPEVGEGRYSISHLVRSSRPGMDCQSGNRPTGLTHGDACTQRVEIGIFRTPLGHGVALKRNGLAPCEANPLFLLVGTAGFELATPCTPCKCATRLRYAPCAGIIGSCLSPVSYTHL